MDIPLVKNECRSRRSKAAYQYANGFSHVKELNFCCAYKFRQPWDLREVPISSGTMVGGDCWSQLFKHMARTTSQCPWLQSCIWDKGTPNVMGHNILTTLSRRATRMWSSMMKRQKNESTKWRNQQANYCVARLCRLTCGTPRAPLVTSRTECWDLVSLQCCLGVHVCVLESALCSGGVAPHIWLTCLPPRPRSVLPNCGNYFVLWENE